METRVRSSFIPVTRHLLERAQSGESEAYAELDQIMRGKINNFVRKRVPPDAVDNVVQECMIAVWRQLPRFDPALGHGAFDRNFNNWTYTIARNRISVSLRDRYRDPRTQSFDETIHSSPRRTQREKQLNDTSQADDNDRVPLIRVATADQYRTIAGGSRYQWALQRNKHGITINPEVFNTLVRNLRKSKKRYFPPTPDHHPLAHFAKNQAHYSQLLKAAKRGKLPVTRQGRYLFATDTDYNGYSEKWKPSQNGVLPQSGTVFQYEESSKVIRQ